VTREKRGYATKITDLRYTSQKPNNTQHSPFLVGLGPIFANRGFPCHISFLNSLVCLVLKMVNDRRVIYDRFSVRGAHSTEWVQITKDFLNLAFVGGHHVAKCPCKNVGTASFYPSMIFNLTFRR
jgi:hypothetical protein